MIEIIAVIVVLSFYLLTTWRARQLRKRRLKALDDFANYLTEVLTEAKERARLNGDTGEEKDTRASQEG